MLHDFEQDYESVTSWMDTIETNLHRKPNASELRIHQQSLAVCKRFEIKENKYFEFV